MKVTKRLLAALLSVAMLLAMAVPAFAAAGSGKYTISTQSDDTHTYTVYQILTGTLGTDTSKELGQVVAGANFKTENGKGSEGANMTAAEAATYFATLESSTTAGQATANAVAAFVDKTTSYGTVSMNSSLTGVETGYYLIVDTTENMPEGDSYSTSLVKVAGNVTITPKKGTVTFEKKVQDINDSQSTTYGTLQDSADYDVNDHVPFTLTGTLPANYATYTTYYYQFSDQMEAGLTFDGADSLKVYAVNGDNKTEINSTNYSVSTNVTVTSPYTSGFTVTFTDLKSVKDTTISSSTKIVVEYTSTLNSNAVIGSTGNVNEAKLTYSNNPNQGGEGSHGETPWDQVIVFTYKVVVNKTDSQNAPLAGAGFTLYKKDSNGNYNAVGSEIMTKAVTGEDGAVTSYTSEFLRVDDGDYKLVETTVPSGYNKAADVEFTINATHDATWSGKDRTNVLTVLGAGDKLSGSVETGALTTAVINQKGAELPETGGIGTTIFYVVGGCMMFGAAVLLITKKRMENN